jgi:hypothetical protein
MATLVVEAAKYPAFSGVGAKVEVARSADKKVFTARASSNTVTNPSPEVTAPVPVNTLDPTPPVIVVSAAFT